MLKTKRKTITTKDVQELKEKGLEVFLLKGSHPRRYFGLYCPEKNEVRVYLPRHKSSEEINDTILHEFCHALEGSAGFKEGTYNDSEIEEIIKETLYRRPETIRFIKRRYSLEY